MQIHVTFEGRTLGPFSLDDLNSEIAAGRLPLRGPLVWWEGCADWRPLGEVPGIISHAVTPPVMATQIPPQPPPQGDATGGLIPYKNAPALVGYYLGIVSLLPVIGIPFALAAVPLGIIGLRKRKREPHVKGSVHAWIGIICGTLSILGHLGVFILAAGS